MLIPETLQPTSKPGRITAMDTIRGISLFAILLMNIIGFGLYKAYFDPTNNGGSTGWSLNVWWMKINCKSSLVKVFPLRSA